MNRLAQAGSNATRAVGNRQAGVRRSVSWSQIERAILLRIARKEYVPGQRIPTCEALAAELGRTRTR